MSLFDHRTLFLFLISIGFFLITSRSEALTENEIRRLVQQAQIFEKQADWEKAREIYEALLNQRDFGLNIRNRYQQTLRHCWQVRRHQDPSYRKEVLSIEYGQALRLYNIISTTLLDGALDKKKLDSGLLFRKGVEELDAALGDPLFLSQHLPVAKPRDIESFRVLLRKTWGDTPALSRKEAAKMLGEVAMAAEVHLSLDATVVAMEFACGSCYAIDDFTAYLTPNQLRELAQSLSRSEVVGVGLLLSIQDSKIIIHQIALDSEASQLSPPILHDQIISVNKKGVVDLPLHRVKEMLEGPAGSTVDIELMSPTDMSIRPIRLQRRALLPSVNFGMLPDSAIGYVNISGFTESTIQDVDHALNSLTQNGMKGLVLDLRDNNGGVFESAIETARRFLSTGIITSTLHQDAKYNFVYHAKNPNALLLPMVVLVNGDTASAAEVLAGALKENDRALLIGQTTFGKGCTQCVLKLPNALGGVPTGGLKLTVARFFSPKGMAYSGRGIVPHILIDDRMAQSEAATTPMNPYLLRAVDELNRMMMQK